MAAQAKVLRVLQEGEIQKLGSEKTLKVDVRVVSGTHKDLKALVAKGLFREDLLYRISVVPILVPSLRDRREDIPLLIYYFLKKLCEKNNLKEKRVSESVVNALINYSWPGNIRELKNILERITIMSGDLIELNDLPEEVIEIDDRKETASQGMSLKAFRDQAERSFVLNKLKNCRGNITKAADELGIGRTYLHKRMDQLGLQKKEYLS